MQLEPGSPQDWIRHAQSDLAVAQQHLGPDVLLETLCYHTQQAVEKSLKAALLHHHIDFPYTHNIAWLITIVRESGVSWPDELDAAAELTSYAVQARYPGSVCEVTHEEYVDAIAVAEKVMAWANLIITA